MRGGDRARRFAHSLADSKDEGLWEPLDLHLRAVAAQAARFAASFGLSRRAEAAGLLHDIGKNSDAFQDYIRGKPLKVNHSTAGAREAERKYGREAGRLLAFAIAGQHAGLGDGGDLTIRLTKSLEPYDGWENETGPLPELADLAVPKSFRGNAQYPGFHIAFLARMVFSCLVDADYLQTEAFYNGGDARPDRDPALPGLRDRLRAHRAGLGARPANKLHDVRADILTHAKSKAALPPGLFTITVPTRKQAWQRPLARTLQTHHHLARA